MKSNFQATESVSGVKYISPIKMAPVAPGNEADADRDRADRMQRMRLAVGERAGAVSVFGRAQGARKNGLKRRARRFAVLDLAA